MALTTYLSLTATSGSAGVKGAYTQVVASTPYDSSRLYLLFANATAAQLFFLVDVATGPAASETVVVANVSVAVTGTTPVIGQWVPIDVDIPAGTRLAVRSQSVSATVGVTLSVMLESRPLASIANPVTYGADTSSSTGTNVDPGAVSSTKGSYVQFSASTSARIDAVALCFTITAQSQPIANYQAWNVDLATGAGGSETVVIGNVRVDCSQTTDVIQPALIRLPVSIPAGTRLAVRCDCNLNSSPQRLLRVTVIGMQEPASGSGSGGSFTFVG